MPRAPTFRATEKGYNNMYNSIRFTRSSAINTAARKIIRNKKRYQDVEKLTGVPWYWIGVIHMRESSNNFRGVLHNGEHIIGTGRKTRLVPSGRGPFSSWESAAVDAIKIKRLHRIKDWSIARMLYEAERFNGWGYTWKGVNSPYVWGGTNHQQPGKYIRDHVWSSTAMDKQLGIAPVLYKIRELEGLRNDIGKQRQIDISTNLGNISDRNIRRSPSISSHWLIRLLRFLFVKGK